MIFFTKNLMIWDIRQESLVINRHKNIEPYEILSWEGIPTIRLYVTVNFLNKDIEFAINEGVGILSDDCVQFEGWEKYGGKGFGKLVRQIDKIVGKIVIVIRQKSIKCWRQSMPRKVLSAIQYQLCVAVSDIIPQ